MDYSSPWTQLGEVNLLGCGPPRNGGLVMDPIAVAGVLLIMEILVGCSARWLANVVDILRNGARVKDVVKIARASRTITSAKVWEDTLIEMRDKMGMFKFAGKDRRAWGRFFLVPKADGSGRAVLDLAEFSKMCFRPPPVNLPGIAGLLRRIGRWRWKTGYGYSVDLRHYFFQIPVGNHLANFFTVRCRHSGGPVFQSKVLPMGWSWSPHIAQCLAWGMVLGELPEDLRKMVREDQWAGDTPPAFVPLYNANGDEVGLIVVWYDNFLVLGEDKEVVEAWKGHIERRAQKCDARWKTSEEKRQVVDTVEFLGLRFAHSGEGWKWQHADVSKWERMIPEIGSRRFYARIVGVIMWDATVSGRGAGADQDCVEVLRKISAGVTCRSAWAEDFKVTPAEATVLQRKMEGIHAVDVDGETTWFRGTDTGRKGFVWIASDASDTKMAFVHLADTGPRLPKTPWSEPPHERHIYYKEMEAARAAVEWACLEYPGHVVVLATDNMAVFWAIKRGYTQAKGAQDDVRRINEALHKAGCDLEAVLVPGKWNVADQPSRGALLCPDNERHTRRVIQEALSGKSRLLCEWASKLGEGREEKERKVAGWRWAPGMEEEACATEGLGDGDEAAKPIRRERENDAEVSAPKRRK